MKASRVKHPLLYLGYVLMNQEIGFKTLLVLRENRVRISENNTIQRAQIQMP